MDRKSVTHLVAGGLGGKKIKHARSWEIEIVTMKLVKVSVNRGFAQNIEQKEDNTCLVGTCRLSPLLAVKNNPAIADEITTVSGSIFKFRFPNLGTNHH